MFILSQLKQKDGEWKIPSHSEKETFLKKAQLCSHAHILIWNTQPYFTKSQKILCKMNMGISLNTRTETVSQGRVLRLWRTKNISGSICSVIYLVYLKRATGPTFLNLWNRIKRSPETRTKNPHRGSGPNSKHGCIFHTVWHVTSCFHRDTPSPLPRLPPDFPSTDLIKQHSVRRPGSLCPKGQQLSIQNDSHHNRLSQVWTMCSGSPYFRKQLSRIRLMRGRQSFCPLLRNNSYVEQLY